MRPRKTAKPKELPFSDEQIRAKAYQVWQKNEEHSSEENWDAAIKALKTERLFRPLICIWQWTGVGEKKLWDFLQLLIVPGVLLLAGWNLQDSAKQREQQAATDKAQQETLVKYLDQMAESIKTDDLLRAKPGTKSFLIAQIRTVTVLQQLNPDRQRAVIQFLRTANLFDRSNRPNKFESSEIMSKNVYKINSYGLLYKARMPMINLKKADLNNADLKGVDLSGADLSDTNLSNTNLMFAKLNNTDLKGASLRGANLNGASLNGANLNDAFLHGANLRNAILTCSILNEASRAPASLVCAKLRGADLSDTDLSNAKLNDADLSNANFLFSSLSNADLSNANLSNANLSMVNLKGTDFNGAKLYNVDLISTDLDNIDLRGAQFCKTILPNWEVNNSNCKIFK
jgi:uncharacterized protein YjbI with pentapeptide repeats